MLAVPSAGAAGSLLSRLASCARPAMWSATMRYSPDTRAAESSTTTTPARRCCWTERQSNAPSRLHQTTSAGASGGSPSASRSSSPRETHARRGRRRVARVYLHRGRDDIEAAGACRAEKGEAPCITTLATSGEDYLGTKANIAARVLEGPRDDLAEVPRRRPVGERSGKVTSP